MARNSLRPVLPDGDVALLAGAADAASQLDDDESPTSDVVSITALVSRETEHKRVKDFLQSALRRAASSKGGHSMCT